MRTHRVPHLWRHVELLAQRFGISCAEAHDLPLHEQRQAGLGGRLDELPAGLRAGVGGVETAQRGE